MKVNDVRKCLMKTGKITISSHRGDGSFVARSSCGFRVACCEKNKYGVWVLRMYPVIDFTVEGCPTVARTMYSSVHIPLCKIEELMCSGILGNDTCCTNVDNYVVIENPIEGLTCVELVAKLKLILDIHQYQVAEYLFDYVGDKQKFDFAQSLLYSEINPIEKNTYCVKYKGFAYILKRIIRAYPEQYYVYSGGTLPIGDIKVLNGRVKCDFVPIENKTVYDKMLDDDIGCFSDRKNRIEELYQCISELDSVIENMEPKV